MQDSITLQPTPKLCECGCGNPVRKPTHRFLQGHNSKYPYMTPEKQFWGKVNKFIQITQILETRCWFWMGAARNGYGVLNVDHKVVYAHRFSYELHFGPLAKGMSALHRCDNPICVNPDHLFAGTKGDNNRDTYAKGRANIEAKRANGGQKLNAYDVREIRKLSANGIKYPAIAKQFGVSIPAISLIVTRKRWPHVE